MTPFDAINISMCAVPTAGSPPTARASPIGTARSSRPSPSCSWWPAARTSFCCSAAARQAQAFLTHLETPLYFGTIARHGPGGGGFFLGQGVSGDGAEALRQGTFQVVSILTSTGFQTIPSFADLGPAPLFLFGLLMLVGAEARSTSGGIKLYRVAVASLGLGHDLHERYGNKRHRDEHQYQSVSGSGRCSPW